MRSKRRVLRRIPSAACRSCSRGAVIVAVAIGASCDDQSVVGPPPPAAEPAAMSSPALSVGPMSDRDILVALYEATDGPNWFNSENWRTDVPLGEWYGVETDASGRVVRLDLGGRWDTDAREWIPHGLSGAIPAELGNLTDLIYLQLQDNQLSGTIPVELGSLVQLEDLLLSSNELTGTVPLIFLELLQLRWFQFEDNGGLCLPADLVTWYEGIENREGPVCPDADVLRALYEAAGGAGWTNADGWLGDGPLGDWWGVDIDTSGRVSAVDLEGNGLSGSLPRRLGDLAGLTILRIGDPALSGRLPSSLSRTPLQELRYANTDLCIPAEAWFREWLATIPDHEGTGMDALRYPTAKS